MKIACIQSQQYVAYNGGEPGEWTLDRIRAEGRRQIDDGFALMEEAAGDGADFLVTIECFNASFRADDARVDFARDGCEPLDGPLVERFAELARARRIHVVAGLLTTRAGLAYNSALLFGPDGNLIGLYDKTHMPAGEERGITPGNDYPVFETEHGNVGMLICWDMQYPEPARILAMRGADLIALPTWGWELAYGPARAYENSVTVAAGMGLAYHGTIWEGCAPSCIVDNMGRILAEGQMDATGVVSAQVDIRREPAPQYGAGGITGMNSMRQIRFSQRRPETYGPLLDPEPPLANRYSRRNDDAG